jgi:hypothetical protein
MTYVLIVVLVFKFSGYSPAATTITANFSTLQQCEAARKHHEKLHNEGTNDYTRVVSHGCFRINQ